METFIAICVLFTVAAGVLIGTLLIGFLMAWAGGDKEETIAFAWFISSVGFIFSLMYVLKDCGVLE